MNDFDKSNDLFDDDMDDLLSSIQRYTNSVPPPIEPHPPQPAWQAFAPPPEELMDDAPRKDSEGFRLSKTPDELWREDGLPPFAAAHNAEPPPKTPEKQPKQKRPKRKKSVVKRILIVLLALVLMIFGSIGTIAFFAAGRMNHEPLDAANRAVAHGPASSPWVTTILFIGIDEPMPRGRADTMLLASIDHRTQSIKLTSILRDSWVRFPDGNSRKINEVTVGANGSGARAMRVVSENFNVRIDHYVLLNFDVFEQIIDAVGGISVPMTQREINFLHNTTRLGRQIGRPEMERQMAQNDAVRLTGEQALIFARIRRLDNDAERGRRNRLVMQAMLSAIISNPLRLGAVINAGLPGVYTSISRWNAATLSMSAPLLVFYGTQEYTLPADGHRRGVTRETFRYEIDFEASRRGLREFIYG